MIDVPMPQLGESVAEGTVTKWLVREGDFVEREQILLEVATDKADTEVRAPASGRVTRLVAKEGETLAKGATLCTLDETAVGGAATAAPAKPAQAPQAPAAVAHATPAGLASPSVRRSALEAGVEVSELRGTGEQGRVTRDDVLRAARDSALAQVPSLAPPMPAQVAAPAAAPAGVSAPSAELSALLAQSGGFVPPLPGVGYGAYKVPPYTQKPGDKIVPFSRRRRITADHMVYSKQVSPHVVTVAEVDLHSVSKLREEHKDRFKKEGVPLTFLAFICAATVRALREHPEVNARVLDNSYAVLKDIHLGVAVDTPGGLVVPSIKNADQLSLRGIAAGIDELAQRAKVGKVTADDLSGTTFSVSNPGLKGNLFGGAIISQPNVGILRMGEIKKRPVVVSANGEDVIAIHPVMYIALSYDHRIIDGALANSFLWRVGDLLARGDFAVG